METKIQIKLESTWTRDQAVSAKGYWPSRARRYFASRPDATEFRVYRRIGGHAQVVTKIPHNIIAYIASTGGAWGKSVVVIN